MHAWRRWANEYHRRQPLAYVDLASAKVAFGIVARIPWRTRLGVPLVLSVSKVRTRSWVKVVMGDSCDIIPLNKPLSPWVTGERVFQLEIESEVVRCGIVDRNGR